MLAEGEPAAFIAWYIIEEPVSAGHTHIVSGRAMKPSASGGTRPDRTGHARPRGWLPAGPPAWRP
jgi:hypothetical protein